jgi:hypothetical protein
MYLLFTPELQIGQCIEKLVFNNLREQRTLPYIHGGSSGLPHQRQRLDLKYPTDGGLDLGTGFDAEFR